jgi:hypothetical protein
MNMLRLAARPRARFAPPLAFLVPFGIFAGIAALSACGSDDEDDASKNHIGATDAEPPRLGPRGSADGGAAQLR